MYKGLKRLSDYNNREENLGSKDIQSLLKLVLNIYGVNNEQINESTSKIKINKVNKRLFKKLDTIKLEM